MIHRLSRKAAIVLGIGVMSSAGVAVTTGTAYADNVIKVHYAVTGTSFISKLNTTLNLGQGTLSANVDLTAGTSTSTLTMPPATASVLVLGFIPVTATTVINQLGPAAGTVNLSSNTITSTAKVDLQITSLSVFGVNVPVGGSCQTSPFTISLASDPGFTIGGGGPVSGAFTIPAFHHCGLGTLPLNLTIPGPGNTISLTLGALQPG